MPISITVLSQEAISKRNISNAGDLGTYVPSLATNANFGPEKSSFAIRGFNQEGRTSPTVAVYFADVVAPRANTGTTTGNGAGVGSFFDLQNVQVLKGPQGTLFGRNTTGGAILLVPTKPTTKLEGYVEGSLGSHDMKRVQAVFNAPLGEIGPHPRGDGLAQERRLSAQPQRHRTGAAGQHRLHRRASQHSRRSDARSRKLHDLPLQQVRYLRELPRKSSAPAPIRVSPRAASCRRSSLRWPGRKSRAPRRAATTSGTSTTRSPIPGNISGPGR